MQPIRRMAYKGRDLLCLLISITYRDSPLFCQAGGREFKSRRSRSLKPRFLVERPGFFIGFFCNPKMTGIDPFYRNHLSYTSLHFSHFYLKYKKESP